MSTSEKRDRLVTVSPVAESPSSSDTTFLPPRLPPGRPGQDGGRRDLNRRQRIHDLSAGALTLFLEKGLDAVTIDDVVRAASMAKGSFYRYFENKDELVATVFQPLVTDLLAAMTRAADALEAARNADELLIAYGQFAAESVELLTRHDALVRLYVQERNGPDRAGRRPIRELAQMIRQHGVRMTHASRAHGLLRDVDPSISAIIVIGAVHELLALYVSGQSGLAPAQAAATVIDVILHGVRQPDARGDRPSDHR